MKILTNHVGYETSAAKKAVVRAEAETRLTSFRLLEYETGRQVFSGVPLLAGAVHHWKDWHFWTADFSAFKTPGQYSLECASPAGSLASCPFYIQDDLLEKNTLSNQVSYFKAMRCCGPYDRADYRLAFAGDKTGRQVDAHGGWYDASADYGKHLSHLDFSTYFNPQQLPLAAWVLFKAHAALQRRNDPNLRQLLRRLLDEALYGADYLVRIHDPHSSFYVTVSQPGAQKLPQDRCITPVMQWFGLADPAGKREAYARTWEDSDQPLYSASYRAGAGLCIAALAQAAMLGQPGDFTPAEYLAAAEAAFAFLEVNNPALTNDGEENIVDDYCALLAAADLYQASGKEQHLAAADRRAARLIGRLTANDLSPAFWRADDGERPFFHAADAGFPLVSLLEYLEIACPAAKENTLQAVRRSLEAELALTSEVVNPFGYARQLVRNKEGVLRTAFFFPHDSETAPWWQGENARLASLASAARLAAPRFASDPAFFARLQEYAWNQIHWILGLNPYDSCMLHGSGRNNPAYLFFGNYEYFNLPGGIVNGITSGFDDEEDIDYQLPQAMTGQDSDWRWTEQWLPHAAWFLMAVAAR